MEGRALPMVFSPSTCSLPLGSAARPRYYGICWGLVADCDYARRRRIIANPPKPTARSEKADGSGTGPVASLIEEIIS